MILKYLVVGIKRSLYFWGMQIPSARTQKLSRKETHVYFQLGFDCWALLGLCNRILIGFLGFELGFFLPFLASFTFSFSLFFWLPLSSWGSFGLLFPFESFVELTCIVPSSVYLLLPVWWKKLSALVDVWHPFSGRDVSQSCIQNRSPKVCFVVWFSLYFRVGISSFSYLATVMF